MLGDDGNGIDIIGVVGREGGCMMHVHAYLRWICLKDARICENMKGMDEWIRRPPRDKKGAKTETT